MQRLTFKFGTDQLKAKIEIRHPTKRFLGSRISRWEIYNGKTLVTWGETVDNTLCDERVMVCDKELGLIDEACRELEKINMQAWEACNWNTYSTHLEWDEVLEDKFDPNEM